jgi:hypothetical protein
MLHGLLPSRALTAVAAALACALAGPLTEVAHADDPQVTVVSPGGVQRTLSLAALGGSEDVIGRTYALRSSTGEASQEVTGFSLGAILNAAGADPYGFAYLEVQRPASGSVLLSRDQALDPGAFPDGPPVLYATVAGTGFLRPSSGGGDLNATDSFEAPQGVTILLRKGSALRVRARASTLRTRPGHVISFSALVGRSGAGEQLSYSWYFDDGHSASSAEASHSFAKPGSYDVVLGVTTPGDDTGASAVVTIQVGEPVAGPNRKGGGHNESRGAPDHGAALGPSNGSPAGAAAPATTRAADRSADASPPPKPARARSTPAAPAGRRVSGLLLGAPEPRAARSPARQAAARTGVLRGGGEGGVPSAVWAALASAALLGAGALMEARGGAALLGALNGGAGR